MLKNIKFFCLLFLSVFVMSGCDDKKAEISVIDSNQAEKIVIDNLLTRRSIRAYKETPVPKDIMEIIRDYKP